MFADILERCRDLFSTDRKDLEFVFRRHAHHDEASQISDRELYANLVKGDLTLVALQKAARQDEEAAGDALLRHLRTRLLPRMPYSEPLREEMVEQLVEERELANRTVGWAEQICNRTFYSPYGGTINMGPYLDWYTDLAGKSWFFEHVRGMRERIQTEKLHEKLGMGPVRATWDLNVLHHLAELGKAWWLTGEDRYASQYVLQCLDWMEKNPPNMGVNWLDEMSVARRAIAWVFTLHLFLAAPPVSGDFATRSVKMLLMHGAYLADFLRKSQDEKRPGYRLAAAVALWTVAAYLPEFRTCGRWMEIAEALYPAALEEEFGDDGAHRSGSLDMHRLCCELALTPQILSGGNSPGRHLVLAAFQFLVNVQESESTYQPVGAACPERVLPFGPPFQVDVPGLVALAAVLLGRDDLRRPLRPGWTLKWLGGPDAAEAYRRMGRSGAHDEEVRAYGAAALVLMRQGWGDKDFWGLVRHVPRDPLPSPDDPLFHDDAMHFSAAIGGVRIFTDTGSLALDTRRGRYFDSPLAHNVLVVRDAEAMLPGPETSEPGGIIRLDDGRTLVRGGRRAWKTAVGMVWHQREILYAPEQQSLTLLDFVDGEGQADVEISFQSPADLEIVQRGDLGCIFWKRIGLFRLHPFFPDTFRGSVERGRENGPPAWLCRDGVSVQPLQRIRYTARVKLPSQIYFWMTWNVSGANTPSADEIRHTFNNIGVQGNRRPQEPARGRRQRG